MLIAGPNVVSTLAQTLMSFTDFAIVSQLPNASAAQAAVSSGGMVFFCVFSFLLGTMVCMTTVVSQSLGSGRPRDCSAYAWQGLRVSLAFGLGAFVLWPLTPGIYRLIGHSPDVQHMEVAYGQIRWLGLGLAGATVALAHYFNGIHHPFVNATSVVPAVVLNAGLTYGLTLGKWGMPAMGVEGAAWGTVIATVFQVIWLLTAMCLGRYAVQFHARQTWRFDAEKMRRLIRVGLPSGAAFMFDIAAWSILLVFLVGRFGTTHLAAMVTVWRYCELSFMPAVGIGIAVSTMVGRSIGEGRPDLARRRAHLGAAINMGYMGLMALIYLSYRGALMDLFSDDPPVIRVGRDLFVLAAIFQLFDALGITYSNALRGAGDTRWTAVVGTSVTWSVMVCGGLWVSWAHPELGSRGPWIFATLTVILVGVIFLLRWRHGSWERLDVIGRKEVPPASFEADSARVAAAEVSLVPDLAADPPQIGSTRE